MKYKTTRETTVATLPGVTLPAFRVIDTEAGPFRALSPERRAVLEADCARLATEGVLVPADRAQRERIAKKQALGPVRSSGTL